MSEYIIGYVYDGYLRDLFQKYFTGIAEKITVIFSFRVQR